jgi:hypothetical protein
MENNANKLLFTALDQLEKDYTKSITIADGLTLDYQNRLKMVEFYINSRYLNQEGDEFDVPFMNEVNANADLSKVATDFDTKDIVAEADDGDNFDISLTFNKEIYQWMKRTNFAMTLNDMNSTRVDYGLALVEKVMQIIDGKMELTIAIPELQNVQFDASNILGRPIIQTLYFAPAEYSEKMDVWKDVKTVLKMKRSEYSENDDGQIIVKKLTGKFPVAFFKEMEEEEVDEEDNYIYARYCFYITCLNGKKLYSYGYEEDENPYKLLAWKKRAKRPPVGVIEDGLHSQIWTNDVIQKEHAWFELASKWVGQTASKKLKGRNILSETDNGTILEHEPDKPITTLSMIASAVPEFQSLLDKWGKQYDRSVAITDAARGENPPSGQAFRLQAMVQQQSTSQFDHRREEMGIFIVELFNDWILPYIAKKLNKAHILASDYNAEELRRMDENYGNYHANEWLKSKVLNNKVATQDEYEAMKQARKDFVSNTKEKRFLDIPKNYYKDFKPKITIVTTGEQKNKMAVMETLSNVLSLYMTNPAAFQQDPVASQILSLILERSGAGISPVTLGLGQNKQVATPGALPNGGGAAPASTLPNPAKLTPQAVQNERAIA